MRKLVFLLLGVTLALAICSGVVIIYHEPTPTEPAFNGIPGVIEVNKPSYNAIECRDGYVIVEGKARGWWYFEASFPVEIRDVHGQPLGEFYAEAQSNWMTDEFVAFKGAIPFREPQGESGTIVFKRDNASGLPQHDMSYEMPIRFSDPSIVCEE